jgi:hypothetical protein
MKIEKSNEISIVESKIAGPQSECGAYGSDAADMEADELGYDRNSDQWFKAMLDYKEFCEAVGSTPLLPVIICY